MSDLLSVHLCVSHLRSSDTRVSNSQLPGIRNPVTHPPCCSCGSAHALSSRVEPRAASFAVTRHSCSAALVSWYRVSLCVRSSDRGESRSAERRARMVVVCLGPFPIPRTAVRQLGVSTFVLLYCLPIAIVAYLHTGSCCWRAPTPKQRLSLYSLC